MVLDNTISSPWEEDLPSAIQACELRSRAISHQPMCMHLTIDASLVPSAIQAIFVQVRSADDMIAYARRFHRDFVRTFGLRDVPLLQYDWDHPTEPFSPFDP